MNSLGPAKILIVDDEERNVKLLEALLKAEGYATLSAPNGRDGLAAAVKKKPDLILLDVMMAEMDGFETVAWLKADPRTKNVPVIMVSALDDRDSKMRALELGAEDFLSKPVDRAELKARVRNLLRLKEYSDFLVDHNRLLEFEVKKRTEQLAIAHRDTVLTLVRAAEHKDETTGHHIRRISYYSQALAEAMDQSGDFREAIFNASPMHDIGKIGIPDSVLLKTSAFNDAEWIIMRTHCAQGASILATGTSPYTHMGAEIALNHHECWDGSGYPNGIKGEAIPLSARIMQICDVYDALRSPRPYKPALDHARAVEIITQGDGRTLPAHFDPTALGRFAEHADRFAGIYDQHVDA
jgi:putative two-component system response regulator